MTLLISLYLTVRIISISFFVAIGLQSVWEYLDDVKWLCGSIFVLNALLQGADGVFIGGCQPLYEWKLQG